MPPQKSWFGWSDVTATLYKTIVKLPQNALTTPMVPRVTMSDADCLPSGDLFVVAHKTDTQ